jgi:hypothetical protein
MCCLLIVAFIFYKYAKESIFYRNFECLGLPFTYILTHYNCIVVWLQLMWLAKQSKSYQKGGLYIYKIKPISYNKVYAHKILL